MTGIKLTIVLNPLEKCLELAGISASEKSAYSEPFPSKRKKAIKSIIYRKKVLVNRWTKLVSAGYAIKEK